MSNIFNTAERSEALTIEASSAQANQSSVVPPKKMKRLDLSAIKADDSLSLHKFRIAQFNSDSFVANVEVINFDQVYISDEAAAALTRCYITAPYLLDRFGSHYLKNIMATATRGKLKGVNYIDPEANTFIHETDSDMHIVVSGKCIEVDGQNLRQIHITCAEQTAPSSAT